MNTQNYTEELKEILEYITQVLFKEFPTKLVTLEYLVTAILDNKRCHANMILDNCLMSSNMTELNHIFASYLREHSNIALIDLVSPNYDDEFKRVFEFAEHELEGRQLVGSEHILLSLLKPENKCTKILEIFKNIGIDYSFLMTKCHNDNITKKISEVLRLNNAKKNLQKQLEQMNNIPPKSDGTKLLLKSNNFIQNFTIDLNQQALEGKLDEVVGRETEFNKIVEVLARRKKNNVVLVGLGGVGKTSLVHHIANMIVHGFVPDILKDKKIVQLNVPSLIAGTYLRGAFEERVKGLFDEMKQTNKYILFIDDIHTVLKTSSKEKDTDISSMINDILANGEIKVIGTTTFKDYRNSIESNTMISRRLQKIVIEPTSKTDTINILNNVKHYYEQYHNVTYTDEAIKKCVELSERYITDRSLPDSAIDVLDFSGAHTCLVNRKPQEIIDAELEYDNILNLKTNMINCGDFEGVESLIPRENELKAIIATYERDKVNYSKQYCITIDTNDIYNSITEITNIPVNKLSTDDKKNLSQINDLLKSTIIGQDEAIDTICKSIKRNKIGLGNPNRVIFSGLLVGKSGTGKTLLAKKLAEQIYGDDKALIRIDMSEYSEKSSVSKLIGASAGYIGYDQGGQLTEAVKNKPYCVLLLDEFEKADKEVYNLFLQLFDEGRLTDNSGQIINFKNVIVLMTSNVGVKRAQDFGKTIGFGSNTTSASRSIIEKEIKTRFMPEFLNRLDQIVYFNDLTEENIKNISKLELNTVVKRLTNLGYSISYTDETINVITQECMKQKEYGARPILRYIQDNIEDAITDMILSNETKQTFDIIVENGKITIR